VYDCRPQLLSFENTIKRNVEKKTNANIRSVCVYLIHLTPSINCLQKWFRLRKNHLDYIPNYYKTKCLTLILILFTALPWWLGRLGFKNAKTNIFMKNGTNRCLFFVLINCLHYYYTTVSIKFFPSPSKPCG